MRWRPWDWRSAKLRGKPNLAYRYFAYNDSAARWLRESAAERQNRAARGDEACAAPIATTVEGADTRLADAGCSVHEIAAISGHKSLKEVERYTKAASQAKLARVAMARTLNETGTSSVKPELGKVSKP